jgi:hypothetical protein
MLKPLTERDVQMDDDLGRTIKIYLADGKPSGVQIAEIINWTGQVLQCPKAKLEELADREQVRQPGVYILVGQDPEHTRKDRIYIGEADNVYKRIKNHLSKGEKDFWTDTILVTSKDENLTKSHVGYLESRILSLADQSDRATIDNANTPAPNPLPESDEADMKYFLNQVQLILPVLGFEFLNPEPKFSSDREESPTFVLESVGAEARAKELDGEFIVKQGSTARKEGRESWDTYEDLRDELVEDGRLKESSEDGYYEFSEDVAFSSPSAAAAVVVAGNTSGPKRWKLASNGKSYREWQEEKVEKAEQRVDSTE